MTPEQIDSVIEAHVKAEKAGDFAAAVAMYTDDIEHDVVGAAGGTWSRTSWFARAPSMATTSA